MVLSFHDPIGIVLFDAKFSRESAVFQFVRPRYDYVALITFPTHEPVPLIQSTAVPEKDFRKQKRPQVSVTATPGSGSTLVMEADSAGVLADEGVRAAGRVSEARAAFVTSLTAVVSSRHELLKALSWTACPDLESVFSLHDGKTVESAQAECPPEQFIRV
jgi:hypothetical protein